MTNYRKLEAYKHNKTFALGCVKAAHKFPDYERYALADQLRRAAYSAVLNVAEGVSRTSLPDGRRLLDIGRSSLHEARVIVELANDLGYIDDQEFQTLDAIGDEAGRALYGYLESVTRKIDAIKALKKQKVASVVAVILLPLLYFALS